MSVLMGVFHNSVPPTQEYYVMVKGGKGFAGFVTKFCGL